MAAEAFFLFLDKKKQKSSQPRCFFSHKAFAHDQLKPRAVKFCPAVAPAWPALQQKITMPLPAHMATSFTCSFPKLRG
jgi:hypothetical protein